MAGLRLDVVVIGGRCPIEINQEAASMSDMTLEYSFPPIN